MEARSRKQRPNFDGRKTSFRPPQPNPPVSKRATVFWSNSAYVPDECSSVGSNNGPLPSQVAIRKRTQFPLMQISEEEHRLREELATEIEKELEREIMEGILVLVRRLSELKAKQITHGLKDLWADYPNDCGNQAFKVFSVSEVCREDRDDGFDLSLKMANKLNPKLNQKRHIGARKSSLL